jgi:hypothetical protein
MERTVVAVGVLAAYRSQSLEDFDKKGGKSREIPVRHDLEQILRVHRRRPYAVRAEGDAALPRHRAQGEAADSERHARNDLCRMVKRRMKDE